MQSGRSASYLSAILAFDDKLLEAETERHAATSDHDDLVVEVARAWLGLMRGRALEVESSMDDLFRRAAGSGVPSLVVDVTALRSMLALSLGQLPNALAFARRASLMGRTEGLPRAELLANVVLSRLRRYSGKSYLALRIFSSLSEPAPAGGWLLWERLLAGGAELDAAPGSGSTPAVRAAAAGRRLLHAARAGAREVFERAASELVQATCGFVDMQHEGRSLVHLLDTERHAEPAVLRFKLGESDELSHGLTGVGVLEGDVEPGMSILAVARPGERGQRILRDGLGLFGPCRMPSAEGARRTHGRTDTALAVLLLAGPAHFAEEEFFKRVYGFDYSAGKHRGVLDVLLHRLRQRIGASGVLVRTGGGLHLELHEAIAVADPRCSPPAAARVLSALSRAPLATAESISERLGITPRAVQMALQQLVNDGVCAVRRTGRNVRYQLQDSTFSEPTPH
jgi:DNA-binding transcriptional ArsR family regulator